ncbi:hypothetical protein CTI12_AA127740 [Artemisia annua]|uniref:Uncharacterized protein n=1 Tax=Artemisia annua TaxID=35608 RepID=A0A2U1PPR0_ARTAN|nr:hypothetical protein CTI12_AA127740 [Artemisia annua]
MGRSRFLRNEPNGTDLGATNSHAAITEGKAVNQLLTLQKNSALSQVERSRFLRNEPNGTDLGATNSHAAITEGKAVNQLLTLQKNSALSQVERY